MKWVTLICLFLCTIVTESRHLHKRDAEHHPRLIGPMFLHVGKPNFKRLLLVLFAQNFQKCELSEHQKAVEELSDLAQDCVDNEDQEKCKQSMINIFHDKICQHPNLGERYPWSVECCTKAEPEREKCFHDHRDVDVEPYQRPDAEAACKEHKEHPERAFSYYIYNIARRHSGMHPPSVLSIAAKYSNIVTECCEAEDKVKCFEAKFAEAVKATHYIEIKQKHVCHVLSTFDERVYMGIKIAKISQKHPNADLAVVLKLSAESLHMSKDCCKGNDIECMAERMEYTEHICEEQEKISPSLKACCERPLLERTPCIIALPKDDVPADLPPMTAFIEDANVCKSFAKDKNTLSAKFLYEYSRRHPELSLISLLRTVKGFEDLLTACCASGNPGECLMSAQQRLDAGIKESKALLKQHCDFYRLAGSYGFQIMMMGLYTPKMPQAPTPALLEFTYKMAETAGKCCALPETQGLVCADEMLDLLLGEMCERQKHKSINEQVHHCCVDSYANRRNCFTKLDVDKSYQPSVFEESSFKVGPDFCEGSEQELKNKRLALIATTYKVKPDIPKDKMKTNIEKFTTIREKCCAEEKENRQACFALETPGFLLHFKASIGH